ncbi:4361_t:CDS:2, partial [Dentiscutata heterogama]
IDADNSNSEISILRADEADNIIKRLMNTVLEVTTYWLLVYIGNSKRTKRRQRQIQQKATVVNHAIPIFKAWFLDVKALFTFNNTTSHCVYTEDALIAKNMNLSSSKDYNDPDLYSKPKGLREVLSKRELWHDKIRLVCKEECKQGKTDYCTRTTIAIQPDFKAQYGKLEEAIIFVDYYVI